MKLDSVRISFPFVSYSVEVSHFASRQATAIEWVVLEAIHAAACSEEFKNAPFSSVFDEILSIKEADRLIKPVISDLAGLNMISVQGLSDKVSLNEMTMSQFELTEKGQKLRRDGTLPGRSMQDIAELVYDPINDSLTSGYSKSMHNEATGISAINGEPEPEIQFPASLVLQYFDSVKGSDRYPWLSRASQIEDITEIETNLIWRNVTKSVDVDEHGTCSMQGIEDKGVVASALQSLPLNVCNFAVAAKSNTLDSASQWVDYPDNILVHIDSTFASEGILVLDAKVASANVLAAVLEAANIKAVLIGDAPAFACEQCGESVIVSVPEMLLPSGLVAFAGHSSLKLTTLSLTAGSYEREASLLHEIEENSVSLLEIADSVARHYSSKTPEALIPLFVIDQDEKAKCLALEESKQHDGLKEAKAYIASFNEACERVCGIQPISNSELETVLSEKLVTYFSGCSYEDVCDRVETLFASEKLSQDNTLAVCAINTAITALPATESVDEIWRLWENFQKRNWLRGDIPGPEAVTHVYSEKVVSQILAVFEPKDLSDMPEFTIVESSMNKFRHVFDNLKNLLPNARLLDGISKEEARIACLSNKSNLMNLYLELNTWRTCEDRLSQNGVILTKNTKGAMQFSGLQKSIAHIEDALNLYFDESTLKCEKIVVVDTCAVMNEPSLIDCFDDSAAMLIIPKIVLEELDGNKVSPDESKASKARDAIRSIDNHRLSERLNLREESNPDLLSDDSDKNRNDNKVLSVALKYQFKNPLLITDDANLRNLAKAHSIEAMSAEAYLGLRKEKGKKMRLMSKSKRK